MKDQPNIFFVVLTGPKGPMAINVADIVCVLPDEVTAGCSAIYLRDGNAVLKSAEPPDEVARKINAALSNTLLELAQVVLKIAGRP